MRNKLLSLIPYTLVLLFAFYLLPLLIRNTGAAIIFMLFVIPLITFLCALHYGSRHNGFNVLFPIITTVIFIPSVYIFYNASALIYVIGYAAVAFAGIGIGGLLRKG